MSAGPAEPGKRKAKVGRVVSDKMDKTIVVSVERLSRHRLYKRVIRLTTKFKAHDEHNEARIGDTVRIDESRPLSAPPSAGAWSRSWPAPAEGATEGVVAEETATSEAIHGAAHPGRHDDEKAGEAEAATAAEATRVIQASSRLKVADNTGARVIECIRIMGRSQQDDGRCR